MTGAGRYRDRVTPVTLTRTDTEDGPTYTETVGEIESCNVTELSWGKRNYQGDHSNVTHKVRFRGAKAWNFRDTVFNWGGKRLRPVAPPMRPGHRNITIFDCVDETLKKR